MNGRNILLNLDERTLRTNRKIAADKIEEKFLFNKTVYKYVEVCRMKCRYVYICHKNLRTATKAQVWSWLKFSIKPLRGKQWAKIWDKVAAQKACGLERAEKYQRKKCTKLHDMRTPELLRRSGGRWWTDVCNTNNRWLAPKLARFIYMPI